VIIFSTKDAGPAAYLSEIIKVLNEPYICVASSFAQKIFDVNNIKSTVIDFSTQEEYGKFVEANFKEIPIKLIITGTSWGNSIDKAFIKFGIEKNINVISIIDHWSWYKERFLLKNALVLPNFILVNDEYARDEAKKEGLDGNIIYAIGNPVLENKVTKATNIIGKDQWLKNLNLADKKIITFISEEYAKDFPMDSSYYQGFDEYQVLEDILDLIGEKEHLLIKLHPSEKMDKYDKYKRKNVSILYGIDLNPLIIYSDIFIGMGSMLLMEAAVLRDVVISYRPNDKKGFIGNRIGATILVQDKQSLNEIFEKGIKFDKSNFAEKFKGSTERIVDFVKGYLD